MTSHILVRCYQNHRGVYPSRDLGAVLSPGIRGGVGSVSITGHPAPSNFWGSLSPWSSKPLRIQPRKQSRGGFTDTFEAFLSFVFHGFNHGERTEQGVVRVRQGRVDE